MAAPNSMLTPGYWVILVVCMSTILGIRSTFVPTDPVRLAENPPIAPASGRVWFDSARIANSTALLGATGFVTCHICAVGNATVSWVRHSDAQLLTVGRTTYTSDQRFVLLHPATSDEWTLKIVDVRRSDAGLYACQVGSAPPVSYPVFLTVAEPETELLGGPEVFVDALSTINLTCVVRKSPKPLDAIFWKHNGQAVSYGVSRDDVTLVTSQNGDTASHLIIRSAQPRHSGIYTCQPLGAASQTVKVHVLDGESPAAMQTSSSCPISGAVLAMAAISCVFSTHWLSADN